MLAGRAPSSFETNADQKVPIFSAIRNAEYMQVIIATLLVYDMALTMDVEARYFWKRKLNATHFIFFANRYVGLLTAILPILAFTFNVTHEICTSIAWIPSFGDVIIYISIDYVLMLRVLALYMNSRQLALFLKLLLTIEAGMILAASIGRNLFIELAIGILDEGVTFCGDFKSMPLWAQIIPWAMPLANGLILMCLALYKSTRYWKESASFHGLGLVKVVILDQAVYFGFLLFSLLSTIISNQYLGLNPVLGLVLNELGSPILLCVLGSRLLFNLKEAAERGVNMGTSYKVETLSIMQFS